MIFNLKEKELYVLNYFEKDFVKYKFEAISINQYLSNKKEIKNGKPSRKCR
jgi:hypothetical protein